MEEDEKDFKVTDKRISFDEAQAAGEKKRAEEERPKAAPEKGKAKVIREKVAEQEEGLQARLPHIDFSSFIFSLAHSALIQLGEGGGSLYRGKWNRSSSGTGDNRPAFSP